MIVLGFDTSLPTTSVAIVGDGLQWTTPTPQRDRLFGRPRHSEELLPSIDEALDATESTWNDVDLIAVGIGPGTFTGLRIGVATARALAPATETQVAAVGSLGALALGAGQEFRERPVAPLIDARRGQVFASLYGPGHEQEWEASALDPEDLLARLIGIDGLVAIGDWALRSESMLQAAGIEVPPYESGLHAVSAVRICQLGVDFEPRSFDRLEPSYVRLPDAEINLRARQEGADVDA